MHLTDGQLPYVVA